jgi:tRNA(Ile)-lysidine synthase
MSGLDLSPIHVILDDLKSRYGARFIIGLSGGGDSIALTHICAAWARQSGAHLSALCIDHGLRAASKDEAIQAQAWADAMGIGAQIVTNTQPPPPSGLQAFARALRLSAFAKAAYEAGGATILLGHNLDDQAETIALRLARQTGLDGLAGIATVQHNLATWEGQSFPIARPLLSVTRQALRAYLADVGQNWIEDPSNQNHDFSRVKTRHRLTLLNGNARLAHIGQLAADLRDKVEAYTDMVEPLWAESGSDLHNTYPISCDFLAAAPVVRARLLRKRLLAAGATSHHFERRKINHLVATMAQQEFSKATLGGILITKKSGLFHFSKAPPRRKAYVVANKI